MDSPEFRARRMRYGSSPTNADDDGGAVSRFESSGGLSSKDSKRSHNSKSPHGARRRHSSSPTRRKSGRGSVMMQRSTSRGSLQRAMLSSTSRGSLQSLMSITPAPPTGAQVVVWTWIGGLGLWFLGVSMLLLLTALFYSGNSVGIDCERYASSAADRISARAATVLSVALTLRDAMHYAVQRKLYFDPLDYAAIKMAVEPVLVARPEIRAVDLAFGSTNITITIRRVEGMLLPNGTVPPGTQDILMQSDAADCNQKLGLLGCSPAVPAHQQAWYPLALQIPGGQEADSAGPRGGPRPSITGFRWLGSPGFTARPQTALELRYAPEITWAPAYSLIFRSVFPGTRGNLSVVGRVTVDISGIRAGSRLHDGNARLSSPGSGAYICDRTGAIVVAMDAGQQVRVQEHSGRVLFRRAWELREPWAPALQEGDFRGGSVRLQEGFYVVVAPLRGRGMDHFNVLVAVGCSTFVDSQLSYLCSLAYMVVVLPYPVVGAIVLSGCFLQRRQRLKKQRRVHPMPGKSGLQRTNSGKEDWVDCLAVRKTSTWGRVASEPPATDDWGRIGNMTEHTYGEVKNMRSPLALTRGF